MDKLENILMIRGVKLGYRVRLSSLAAAEVIALLSTMKDVEVMKPPRRLPKPQPAPKDTL